MESANGSVECRRQLEGLLGQGFASDHPQEEAGHGDPTQLVDEEVLRSGAQGQVHDRVRLGGGSGAHPVPGRKCIAEVQDHDQPQGLCEPFFGDGTACALTFSVHGGYSSQSWC